MKYFLGRNGQILGQHTLDELRAHLQTGYVLPSDHVLPEGGTQWLPVTQVLSATAPGLPPSRVTPPLAPPPPVLPPKPKTYLVAAILVTLLCCLPVGIAAIIYSTQVDSKYARGDYAGAAAASKRASVLSWVSFGVGLVAGGIYFCATVLGAMKNIP